MCNCDCRLTDKSCTKNIGQVRVQGSVEISKMDQLSTRKDGEDRPVSNSNLWNISGSTMISYKDITTTAPNQSHLSRRRRSSESVTVNSSKFSTNQSDQQRRPRSSHKGSWSSSSSSYHCHQIYLACIDSIQNKPVPYFRDRLIITVPCEIVNWQSRYVLKNKSCGRMYRQQVMRTSEEWKWEFESMICDCDKFVIIFSLYS